MGINILPAPPQLSAKPAPGSNFGGKTKVTPKDPFAGMPFGNAVPVAGKGGGLPHQGHDNKGGGEDGGEQPGSPGSASISIPGFEQLGELIHYVLDPIWWRRVGLGVLGFAIVLAALVFIIASTNAGKKAIKTGAGAIVAGPAGAAAGASS